METANYEYRRRDNERVYDAPVTYVRAVMGAARSTAGSSASRFRFGAR